ncbi:MAG: RluA family pseudouridine synthase [Proteobacteria bacterium]|nr:RluA family pseudouridine synthase [Pseudomonadota bacterium]
MLPFEVIYIDNHLLVVRKPAGMLVQGDRTGDISLLEHARIYLKREFNKPGNVYLGLVHRLDRPVSGVVVLARTSKAAARLSEQFRKKEVTKIYWALVQGKISAHGKLTSRIERNGATSRIVVGNSGKIASLLYRRIAHGNGISLVEVELETGRHHQIRVQLADQGYPILGDFRYGSKVKFPKKALALHARGLTVAHPVRKEKMEFVAELESFWPLDFQKT